MILATIANRNLPFSGSWPEVDVGIVTTGPIDTSQQPGADDNSAVGCDTPKKRPLK